jgi:uncharacterized protein
VSVDDFDKAAWTPIARTQGSKWFRTSFRRLLVLAGVPWVIAMMLLVFLERSMLYPAPAPSEAPLPLGVEEVRFLSADGSEVKGWFRPREGATRTVVYFHGNGEDVPRCWSDASHLGRSLNANLFLPEYRGYGSSSGKPVEDALVRDGIAAFDWVRNREGIGHLPLVLAGRSIGAGVASCVAGQRPPDVLVLISGFSSIVDVAASKFPIFPVRLLMKNRYDCQTALAEARFPILMIHAAEDSIIPIRFGKKLFDALPERKRRFVELEKFDHNDFGSPDFLQYVADFMAD